MVVGLTFAGLLYIKNPYNKFSHGLTLTLAIIRFILVSAIVFLLLSPYIRTKQKRIEKPVIAIGIDNSQSVINSSDSVYYKYDFLNELSGFRADLNKNFEIDFYTFGEKVKLSDSIDFKYQISNYSEFISEIYENYNGLNIGAIVLFGDGISNIGIDPTYAVSKSNLPIFTVALGDTTKITDIKIDDVRYNSIVYSGDVFPVEISISANDIKNKKTTVRLLENNKVLDSQIVEINKTDFHQTLTFNISADKSGKRRIVAEVVPIDVEIATKNNFQNLFIDVLDSRIKILIYSGFPHPDVGAIKNSLENNTNYITQIAYSNSPSLVISDFDAVILYQLPSKQVSINRVLKDIMDNGRPTLYVVGSQSNLYKLNDFDVGVKFNSVGSSKAYAKYEFNPSFSKFSFASELSDQLASLPPLEVPLTNISLTGNTEVMSYQRISGLVTDYPMVAYSSINDVRSAIFIGEGIWQWRVFSFLKYNNTSAIDALLSKTIMFLTSEVDKRRFKVITKGDYNSRNDIELQAELYSEVLEPVNNVDVDLLLVDEEKNKFSFVFSPFDNFYKLNLNKLKPGKYNYSATTKLAGVSFKDQGEFIVDDKNIENRNMVADHRLLNHISEKTGGQMVYPRQMDELITSLNSLDTLKTKIHYQDVFTGLNSIIYVLLAILILLSLEWFLRKYFGGY